MLGTLVGHYRIVSPLGSGSMGDVFKAENTHLRNQFVAIKFLGTGVLDRPAARERFEREARAIASLNHPNICVVLDAGEYEGRPYIVMEYLDGKSLRDLLTHAPLDQDLLLKIGLQLCDGLQAAHSKGIVHRDIKPSNIMVTKLGHAKILDFGLAKLVVNGLLFDLSSVTTEKDTLTGEGALVGTVPYMSPEQALGRPLNQRSDLFSLGVVLYELAGGVHPFRGETQAAVCNEILHKDPPSIIRMNPFLPVQFDNFFRRALEKDPDCRFQTAADMGANLVQIQRKLERERSGDEPIPEPRPNPWPKRILRVGIPLLLVLAILFSWNPDFINRLNRILGITSLPEKKWVAVLPFEVHCDESNQRPFVEGLRRDLEGVLLGLSRESPTFRVFPLWSSDAIANPLEAGREMGVNLALTGSFTCEGQNGTVFLNLVSAIDNALLETDRIDGDLEDRNELANRTRRSVRAMLHLRIPITSSGTLAAGPDLEGIYLEGKGLLSRSDDLESLKEAVIRFDKVVEEVPDFAPAHASLAEAYRYLYRHQPRPEWIERGKHEADLAIALDSQSPDSLIAKGWLLIEFGDWERALDTFDRALELAPDDPNAMRGQAAAFDAGDRPDEAARVLERAIELHPDEWAGYRELGHHYWGLGEYERALDNFQIVSSLLPDSSVAANNVAAAYIMLRNYALAEPVLEASLEKRESYYAHNLLGTSYYHQKRFEEAAEQYEKALSLEDSEWDLWGNLAGTYRLLDLPEEAERCYLEAIPRLRDALEINPEDASLRLDYADYLYEVGEVEESLHQLDMVKALPRLETDPWLMFLMGQVYEKRGQRQEAIDWVIKALENGWSRETVENSPTMEDFVQDPEWRRRVEGN